MSVNSGEDESIPTRSNDDANSPWKKARLDNSTRRSWSLTDKNTNYEVLQEMGVSLLEPDEGDACEAGSSGMHHHKPTVKRKRDIENVNPNDNTVSSTCVKCSSRSLRTRASPEPSGTKSPRCLDKASPLQSDDENVNETSLLEVYVVDEETPLGQCVSAEYMPMSTGLCSSEKPHTYTPLGVKEELILSRRPKQEPVGTDSFAILSDEMMLSVFRWLSKRTLTHCMLVCKRWYRFACDETLWQRLDLGNKTLSKDALGRILARKPIVVRLASSEIGEWKPNILPAVSRIQYLDLSMASIDQSTLDNLLGRCPSLKKLSLESVQLRDSTCELIGKCQHLETLNLTMAQGITAGGLTHLLNGCVNLQSLNISWCNLDEACLGVLVTMLPQRLQRLNIAGARIMTNDMVKQVCDRCPRLLELDVSDCSQLGLNAVYALITLSRLEHLALSRCYLLSAHSITKVSSMPALQYLEVWGMLPSGTLMNLRTALPAIQINQFMFSAIARPTVGTRRTSIWGLRTRD